MKNRPFATLRSVVAEVYGVEESKILSRSREQVHTYPRQVLACAACEFLRWSQSRIAREMGLERSTVAKARTVTLKRLRSDGATKIRVELIGREYARRMIMGEAA